MVQLAEWQERFESIGVRVAGMTYDERAILAAFHEQHGLRYPLLKDDDVKHFEAYGVRNEDYQPGEGGYGIPHPGILYLTAEGIVMLKFAVPGYRQRPPFEAVFEAIEAL